MNQIMNNIQNSINDLLESDDDTPESLEIDQLMATPPIFAKKERQRKKMVGRNLMSAAFGVAKEERREKIFGD
jgi:hypothetical protein